MSLFFSKARRQTLSGLIASFLLSVCLVFASVLPAQAGNPLTVARYVAADGTDLSAVVQCLPKELSQPSLARALQESGNDFLQKVFNTKASYNDYKVDALEAQYLNCLRNKGFTPAVER